MMRILGLSATLAVAAQAIIIPPNVALESFGKPGHGFGHTGLTDPSSKVMVVKCPGCAFAQKENNNLVWTQGVKNALYLNVSVGTQAETLELNGVPFYPPVMSLEAAQVPYIAQVPSTVSLVDIKSSPEKYTSNPLRLTSWSLQAGSKTIPSGQEILTIHLQLSALERQPINIPEVTIHALKNVEGQLMLLKVETAEGHHAPQQCKDWPLLCKWRAIIASKFHGLKGMGMKPHGCHKGKGMGPHHAMNGPPPAGMYHGPPHGDDGMHHGPPHHGDEDKHHGPPHGDMGKHHGPPGRNGSHHGGPPHHGPGRHHHGGKHHGGHWHHRHHKVHRFFHAVARVLFTVFVPILLGVAAGMITYALGMFIGTTIAFVWKKVRPGRQYQPIALSEEDIETPRGSMEKAGFEDEEKVIVEAPPLYAEVEGKEIK